MGVPVCKRLKCANINKCAIQGEITCVVSFLRGLEDNALICTVTDNYIMAAVKNPNICLATKSCLYEILRTKKISFRGKSVEGLHILTNCIILLGILNRMLRDIL